MSASPVEVVENYLTALQAKDLTKLPLAENIIFTDPLAGTLTSKAAVVAFLSHILPILQTVTIHQHLLDHHRVVTRWDAQTTLGVINILEWFEITEDKIQVAQAFFDPRAMTQTT
ncbi:nuclear transport factor 2 family protein [Thermosynechococcaceae cyanobacterium BACA0444]|uniref:Nuclear transport factor 2 family protein n=1 Tax=Pseudocalidococcus azoricus BACA0444 TaxID=2918990 RepID=A0AAE4FPD1_9CYAN|nr:nuclear transport factor 2 family protein [Pseudocalidococcus azoricus]MDS3859651.1 nuclear transport factor 2 family protein [Pseudocalidococcus azoricus BACA0444]